MTSRVLLASLVGTTWACSRHHARTDAGDDEQCAFVVYNRTDYSLDVRVMRDQFGVSSWSLGTINPGERLTDTQSCESEVVWVRGIPVPNQVGAAAAFRYVQSGARLEPGAEVEVWLHYP